MANSYTLIATRIDGDTLYTIVSANLGGTVIPALEVAHFQPQTKAEVKTNIQNRLVTEKRKLDSAVLIASIVPTLDTSG